MKSLAQRLIKIMINQVRTLLLFSVILLSWLPAARSQTPPPQSTLFYNNGEVYVDSGLVVQIFGNTINTGSAALLRNNGEIYVHFDSVFASAQRGFTIDNDAEVRGSGYYEIEPDWTNNSPNFIPGSSHVNLMSDEAQLITGTESTDFSTLEVSGEGVGNDRIKRMTLDTRVLDSLSLTNRELATDSFILRVQNTNPNAITFSTANANRGFVSSLKGDLISGQLERRTANAQQPYIFPVGSSVNPPSGEPFIYRPVDILPANDNINVYAVRFVAESPDDEGYDQFNISDSTCTVNPNFYHFINHPSGFEEARIRVFYDPLQDGEYDYLSQWGSAEWGLIKSSQFNIGAMYRVAVANWGLFSLDSLPFILSDRIPAEASIAGDPNICANSEKLFTARGNSNFYNWETGTGLSIASGQGSDSVSIAAVLTSGYLKMTPRSSTGKCAAPADSIFIMVHPGPSANFSASKYQALTNQRIEFKDSTTGNPIDWYWVFGDGEVYTSPRFKHHFKDIGEYEVKMYVTDVNGCLDSVFKSIEIIEGISVPNVFTPNGDGANDLFYIPNSGMKEYRFMVYNRWGHLIFETTAPEIAWDGYTSSGKMTTEGTYYYVLEARSDANDYTFKGYLTLLR